MTTATLSSPIGIASALPKDQSRYCMSATLLASAPTKEAPDNAYAFATDGRCLAVVNGCSLSGAARAMVPHKLASAKIGKRGVRALQFAESTVTATDIGKVEPTVSPDVAFPPVDAAFPDVTQDEYVAIGLDAQLLADLVASLNVSGAPGKATLLIRLAPAEEGKPREQAGKPMIVVPSEATRAPGAVGLLMPVSCDETAKALADAAQRLKSAADAFKASAK